MKPTILLGDCHQGFFKCSCCGCVYHFASVSANPNPSTFRIFRNPLPEQNQTTFPSTLSKPTQPHKHTLNVTPKPVYGHRHIHLMSFPFCAMRSRLQSRCRIAGRLSTPTRRACSRSHPRLQLPREPFRVQRPNVPRACGSEACFLKLSRLRKEGRGR